LQIYKINTCPGGEAQQVGSRKGLTRWGKSGIGFIYSTERLHRWRKNARLKYILETFPPRNMMDQGLLNDIIEVQGMLK
jgi:CHAD domain-containing protein